mmetsp:Transcript_19868/g.56211  ORF Transcript_19868/g.56211 Transcript_19868/m.56211 type:complete len:293 (-) Transcript_19868:653-1531(-)
MRRGVSDETRGSLGRTGEDERLLSKAGLDHPRNENGGAGGGKGLAPRGQQRFDFVGVAVLGGSGFDGHALDEQFEVGAELGGRSAAGEIGVLVLLRDVARVVRRKLLVVRRHGNDVDVVGGARSHGLVRDDGDRVVDGEVVHEVSTVQTTLPGAGEAEVENGAVLRGLGGTPHSQIREQAGFLGCADDVGALAVRRRAVLGLLLVGAERDAEARLLRCGGADLLLLDPLELVVRLAGGSAQDADVAVGGRRDGLVVSLHVRRARHVHQVGVRIVRHASRVVRGGPRPLLDAG